MIYAVIVLAVALSVFFGDIYFMHRIRRTYENRLYLMNERIKSLEKEMTTAKKWQILEGFRSKEVYNEDAD